jgi:WhiB family redox-sensing transcriptional regulator
MTPSESRSVVPLWHEQAVCKGLPPQVFYGGNEKAPMSSKEIERAKAVCATCPVRRLCFEQGLVEDWGIWGGFTRSERERAQQILGTWLETDDGDLTIIPADVDAVLAAYGSGLLQELAVLK